MTTQHTIRVSAEFSRPPAELLDRLRRLDVSTVGEVMNGRNLMGPEVHTINVGMTLVGPCLTCVTVPGDNLSMHVALHLARPGDVLVITAHGRTKATTVWGDLTTISAQARGVAGLVTDCAVRDCRAIRHLQFPLWAAEVTARGGPKKAFGAVNVPISCSGVVVTPGDLILADDDGVVVVPQAEAEEIVAAAEARQRRESELIALLKAGNTLFELMGMRPTLDALNIQLAEEGADPSERDSLSSTGDRQ